MSLENTLKKIELFLNKNSKYKNDFLYVPLYNGINALYNLIYDQGYNGFNCKVNEHTILLELNNLPDKYYLFSAAEIYIKQCLFIDELSKKFPDLENKVKDAKQLFTIKQQVMKGINEKYNWTQGNADKCTISFPLSLLNYLLELEYKNNSGTRIGKLLLHMKYVGPNSFSLSINDCQSNISSISKTLKVKIKGMTSFSFKNNHIINTKKLKTLLDELTRLVNKNQPTLTLNFSNNLITDKKLDSIIDFLESLFPRRIILYLNHNQIGSEGFKKILTLKGLEKLYIKNNYISIYPLTLPNNRDIKELNIENNLLESSEIEVLLKQLPNLKSLQAIGCSRYPVSSININDQLKELGISVGYDYGYAYSKLNFPPSNNLEYLTLERAHSNEFLFKKIQLAYPNLKSLVLKNSIVDYEMLAKHFIQSSSSIKQITILSCKEKNHEYEPDCSTTIEKNKEKIFYFPFFSSLNSSSPSNQEERNERNDTPYATLNFT